MRSVYLKAVIFMAAVTLLLSGSRSFGQALTASLVGTVTDSSGAVVTGAKITITENQTGLSRSATTNQSGNYQFTDIPPGMYSVSAEQQGFRRESRTNVQVDVNSTVRSDIKMMPGTVNETVTVTDAPPPIQTDRADVGDKIGAVQLAELPVGGPVRNFQGLLALVP